MESEPARTVTSPPIAANLRPTIWPRILAGALAGCLLVLLAHPATRAFFRLTGSEMTLARVNALRYGPDNRLPTPSTPVGRALWVEAASERVSRGIPLSRTEWATLQSLLQQAERAEPNNSFWTQAYASFLATRAELNASRDRWERASRASAWNSHSRDRQLQWVGRLQQLADSRQSWTLATVILNRKSFSTDRIEFGGRRLLGRARLDAATGVRLRYATVRNGELIRRSARSVLEGTAGAKLVDLAAYPQDLANTLQPKQLHLGRTDLILAAQDEIGSAAGDRLQSAFRETDGWNALIQRAGPDSHLRDLAHASVVLNGLPRALLGVTLGAGLLVLGLQWIRKRNRLPTRFEPELLVPLGFAIGGLSFWVLRNLPLSVAMTAAILFLGLGPENPRRTPPEELGPLFGLLCWLVGTAAMLAIATELVLRAPAANVILPALPASIDLMGPTRVFLVIALASLTMLCIVAPFYALVVRFSTPSLLLAALIRSSRYALVQASLLTVVAGPVCLAGDRQLSETFGQILANEPVYYLQR